MYIQRITADNWEGVLNHEETVDAPDLHELERLLRRLDGSKYTMITLIGERDAHLAVGGGSGRYVVYATFDNDTFWNLCSAEAEGVVLLNIGGQEGDYASKQVVSMDVAFQAARKFLEAGELDDSLRWELA
jgi:hypothetical protein